MAINWNLLGPPVDAGAAVQQGFQRGLAIRQASDEARRRDEFQRSAFAAYDPQTGRVDPVQMRSAFAAAGDIEGAMAFERDQASTAQAQRQQAREQLTTIARLLDGATDQASYDRGHEVAAGLGIDVSAIPPTFDPTWVERQRLIVRELIDEPDELTAFQRELAGAGIRPGSPEYRQMVERRYNQPRYYALPPGGRLVLDPGQTGAGADPDAPPPPLTDADFLDEGGAGQPAPRPFP